MVGWEQERPDYSGLLQETIADLDGQLFVGYETIGPNDSTRCWRAPAAQYAASWGSMLAAQYAALSALALAAQ
jgi:hypothetical protein